MEEVKITIFGKDYVLPSRYENMFHVYVENEEVIAVSIPQYFSVFFKIDHDGPDGDLGFSYYFELNETKEIGEYLEDYIYNVKNYIKKLSPLIESKYGEELKNYSAMKEII